MNIIAILEKSGVDINLISVFENSLAGYGGLSVSRISDASYRLNKSGAFPEHKTFLPNPIAIQYNEDGVYKIGHALFQRNSDDYIDIFIYSSNGLPIESVADWSINVSIEVYP